MIIRDGDWTLFESDFLGQRQTWSRQNPDGTTTYRTDYKVDDVMDANLLLRNDTAGERYGDWRLIASVPLALHHRELADHLVVVRCVCVHPVRPLLSVAVR